MKALLHITPRPTTGAAFDVALASAGAAFGDAIVTAAAVIRRSPAADAVLVTALLGSRVYERNRTRLWRNV